MGSSSVGRWLEAGPRSAQLILDRFEAPRQRIDFAARRQVEQLRPMFDIRL
jgi:hypothetical protein